MVSSTPNTLKCVLTKNLDDTKKRSALAFCYSASKVDANAIGWLPKQAYDNRHDRGELLTLFNNDDLVGFILMSRPSPYGELRCLQIWVRRDARMMIHGRALTDRLEEIAAERHCWLLRLWCAEDLAANLFWEALGFQKRGWRWGPAKTPRRHNLWTRRVNPSSQLQAEVGPQGTVSLAPATPAEFHRPSRTASPATDTPS